MKRSTLFTAVLAFVCVLLSVEGIKAQGVSGYTSIDYYQDTDTLDAYSETDLDYDIVGNYDAFVSLVVIDGNGSVIATGSARDYDGIGFISVERFIVGTTPNMIYVARGSHYAITDVYTYSEEWPYNIYYLDNFYFTSFEGLGIFEPLYYFFASPGWRDFTRQRPAIKLGTTHDNAGVYVIGQPDVQYTTASILGTQGNFETGNGKQIVTLNASASQCDPYTSFTLTVNYVFGYNVQEVTGVDAVGFGGNHYAEWNVNSVTHDENLSADPKTGRMVLDVNNKNGGRTGTTYNKINIAVKGKYSTGITFSTPASVRINCP